ncbi:glycosyltransferase family 2 protein [Henriciella sp. AS95]|uniref:glycosyltransferase family 2 protein n=1 Tax=Henriciella sp. AS95 TaxID=3135782 RepID=UPI00317428F6
MTDTASKSIAVLLPCYNEAEAIAQTVEGFRRALPTATIYVYDNGSTDNTVEVARQAGAEVYSEPLKGKGNVVRRMFADVEADVYVMADGDATYDPDAAPKMIDLLHSTRSDMIVGTRQSSEDAAYRRGHRSGNRLLTGLVTHIFGRRFTDILSGYRVFSHRFVKSFPALSKGFEIETELTIHALELRAPVSELATTYASRPEGSASKLRTFSDGFRILRVIIQMTKEERPLAFFSLIALFFLIICLAIGVPVLLEYFDTGLVPRQPRWIASVAFAIAALQSFSVGLVLDTVTKGRQETKRLLYLSLPR